MATEAANATKAKTVCICGHGKFLHGLEMEDKQCFQPQCNCWNFMNKPELLNNGNPAVLRPHRVIK